MTDPAEIPVPRFVIVRTDDGTRLVGRKAVHMEVDARATATLEKLADRDRSSISEAELLEITGHDRDAYRAVVDTLASLEGPRDDTFSRVKVTVDDASGLFPTEDLKRACERDSEPREATGTTHSPALEVLVQTTYDPPGTMTHDWDVPTLYAYILGDTAFIDPIWWRNSGRACHTCAQRAFNRRQHAPSRAMRTLQVYGELAYAKTRGKTMASTMELNVFAYGLAGLIRRLQRQTFTAYHPGRYLHVLPFGSMDWDHILVPARFSCLNLAPPQVESLDELF